MEERDVGPCDDWRLAQGWSQVSPAINIVEKLFGIFNLNKLVG